MWAIQANTAFSSFCWWRVLPPYWWLLTDQGGSWWRLGCLWQLFKIRQQRSLLHQWISFWKQVWRHFTHTRTSLKFGVKSLKDLSLLYQLSLYDILNPLLQFQQSSRHLHQSRFHLNKPLSLLKHKKQLLNCSSFNMKL